MKEGISSNIHYIFYLQTRPKLDPAFYMLSNLLSKANINLLPVTTDDIKNLDRTKKYFIVSFQNDFTSGMVIRKFQKDFLFTAMSLNRFHYFDISSFSEVDCGLKSTLRNLHRFIPLPASMKEIALTMAEEYLREKNQQEQNWPGGKRARLPSVGSDV
jgi:hypothetical protein